MKFLRKIMLITCMFAAVALTGQVGAFASQVEYNGQNSIIVTPQKDLFLNSKGLMPGDVTTEETQIVNSSKGTIKVFLKIKGSDANDERIKELLSKSGMTLLMGENQVYSGNVSGGYDESTNGFLICTLNGGEKEKLVANIKVPTNIGNEYMNTRALTNWIFTVEARDDEATPQTGDGIINIAVAVGFFLLSAALGLTLILKSIKYNSVNK